MRYFFHLERDTQVCIDHKGQEFSSLDGVEVRGHAIARELRGEEEWQGWTVLVVDAHNSEILRVPISESISEEVL